MTPRYRLIQDDAGHWYMIRTDQDGDFAAWLEADVYGDDENYTGHDFNENRVDGPHTVTFGEWEEAR